MNESIEVCGKKFLLQPIPNRERIKLKQSVITLKTNSVDLEKILDYGFEHCIIPDGHTYQPTLDSCTPDELEVWEKVLPNFCLNGKFVEPGKGSKKQNKK